MHMHITKSFLTGLLLAVSIFIVSFLPNHGMVLPEVINSSHALVFFLANLFLLKLLLGTQHTSKHIIIISTFSLSIGIIIELIQPFFGRDRSLIDVFYDVVGIVFSSLFFVTTHSKHTLILGFFLIVSAFPFFKYWLWWQVNHASDILTFERIWEPLTYGTDKDAHIEIIQLDGNDLPNKMGKLTLGPRLAYPGLYLDHPRLDWSRFNTLNWELKSLIDTPFTMNLRIHDIDHNHEYEDRFNYRFEVKPGLNRYRLKLSDIKYGPKARKLDLSKIRNMKFFITRPDKTITVYIDNVKLK